MTKQEAFPIINQKLCKKCGICVNICPRKVLEPDDAGLPHPARRGKCTSCEQCVIHCPDFAIELIPVRETVLPGDGTK